MTNWVKQADLPQELVLGWPRSVLLGDGKLIVERHEGVYLCTEKEIIVKTSCGLMAISGEKLSMARYQADDLVVLGKIRTLSYRARGGA